MLRYSLYVSLIHSSLNFQPSPTAVADSAAFHALSISMSRNTPSSVAPQKATARGFGVPNVKRAPSNPLGSKRNFGTLRFDILFTVSCVSAHITIPSTHLNPATIVTALLSRGRLSFGLNGSGLTVIMHP